MNQAVRTKLAEIKFPGEREKLAREAAANRRASPDEKLGMLLEIIGLSEAISSASPHRMRQLHLLAENERREHDLLRDFIRTHIGRRGDEGGSPRGV